MRRIILILVVIGRCSTPSSAMWAWVPLEELVQDCDVIVVGTLDGVSEYSQNGMDYGQGTILIDEVIWGAASAGDSVVLKWQNRSEIVCPRVEHRGNQGKKAIWLLTVEDGGVVRADHPGRFVELSKRAAVGQSLKEKPVCLRVAKYEFHTDEPVSLSLVFRNPTQNSIAFPGVEFRGGQLLANPDVALTMYSGYEGRKTTRPLQDGLILSKSVAPILVGPGQEFRLAVDLRKLFTMPVEDGYFSVQLRAGGFGRSNAIGLYPNLPISPTLGDVSMRTVVRSRERISRLTLLIPSIVAIIVSSFFVYRHRKDFADANPRTPATWWDSADSNI